MMMNESNHHSVKTRPALTRKQRETLAAMQAHHDRQGEWPNLRELAKAIGIGRAGTWDRLQTLVTAGAARRLPGGAYGVDPDFRQPDPFRRNVANLLDRLASTMPSAKGWPEYKLVEHGIAGADKILVG